ncbi:hypothetical protein AAF712_001718 [Marasmius tenuissimus]|uniref:tRNA-guanine(15) transglycosylase-like domain-containing protein n=1 Tax=Marasmius tenuissimus TaxID=585030 RepID=A0ABR3ABR2_9AGAR
MSLSFQVSSPRPSSAYFGPRLGRIAFQNGTDLVTPNLITPTSRGIVPHLSRDNLIRTSSVSWLHVPYESFLESKPPILALGNSMHELLGFKRDRHVVSMSLRDLGDGREMPPNTAKYVSAWCIRGVRKVTPADYREYASKAKPDLVYALADVQPVVSQKRLIKSVERTAEWLVQLLKPSDSEDNARAPSVLLQMPGGQSIAARSAFARTILEPLHPTEIDALRPLSLGSLDDGIAGYVVDGSPDLMKASLDSLDINKPRLAHTSSFSAISNTSYETSPSAGVDMIRGPHDILVLIRDVGIDLFGAEWAVKLAQWGVALDFEFPVPRAPENSNQNEEASGGFPRLRASKRDIGHNLYDVRYRTDFNRLLNSNSTLLCPCLACDPSSCVPEEVIRHSHVDDPPSSYLKSPSQSSHTHPPHTRAYIHHLLHTHEMSSHSLLVGHNLEVFSAFLGGARRVLESHPDEFNGEVEKFFDYYDSRDAGHSYPPKVAQEAEAVVEATVAEASMGQSDETPASVSQSHEMSKGGIGILLYDEARACHAEVERLRGKGSLKRDRDGA